MIDRSADVNPVFPGRQLLPGAGAQFDCFAAEKIQVLPRIQVFVEADRLWDGGEIGHSKYFIESDLKAAGFRQASLTLRGWVCVPAGT